MCFEKSLNAIKDSLKFFSVVADWEYMRTQERRLFSHAVPRNKSRGVAVVLEDRHVVAMPAFERQEFRIGSSLTKVWMGRFDGLPTRFLKAGLQIVVSMGQGRHTVLLTSDSGDFVHY
jgi:hypothetical protein